MSHTSPAALLGPCTWREAVAALAERAGSTAEARWMVEHVAGRDGPPGALLGHLQRGELSAMADRRAAREPLQYILGTWPFRTVELVVDRRALIPRPETELVVEVAMAELRRSVAGQSLPGREGPTVVDLGTGSGAIALSMATELAGDEPGLEVWAIDADPVALGLAAENVERIAFQGAVADLARRVHLRRGEWFAPVPDELRHRVDVVVSNPPYVAEQEWTSLEPELHWEPRQALVAPAGSDGTPGMGGVEAVLAGAVEWLGPEGAAVVELAPHQAAPAARLARRLGYREVRIVPDLAGRDRAVVARPRPA